VSTARAHVWLWVRTWLLALGAVLMLPAATVTASACRYSATVTRVVDADTFDVRVSLGLDTSRDVRVRLLEVDAPEVRGDSRAAGLAASRFVAAELATCQHQVRLDPRGTDSFGRVLAHVTLCDGRSLARALLNSGHARPYQE